MESNAKFFAAMEVHRKVMALLDAAKDLKNPMMERMRALAAADNLDPSLNLVERLLEMIGPRETDCFH